MQLQKINGRYYVGRSGVNYNNLADAIKYIEFCLWKAAGWRKLTVKHL